MSSLAAAIKLHGGPSREELKIVLEALDDASIDPEHYGFGPAYGQAERRLSHARMIMEQLVACL